MQDWGGVWWEVEERKRGGRDRDTKRAKIHRDGERPREQEVREREKGGGDRETETVPDHPGKRDGDRHHSVALTGVLGG